MSGIALGPILAKAYGKDRRAFDLTADYTWGHTQYQSMKDATEKQGWTTVNNIMTPLGTADYSQFLTAFLNTDADVLVLNHYGKDMINSLTQAVQFGIRDMQKNGKQIEIVVPLYSELMAKGAGANIEGVFGTTNWNDKLDDPGSKAIVEAFSKEYGFPPSQAAETAYVQTLLYANACETAGTFYPPEVIKALEDFEFEGMGPGKALMRAGDHQCFHDILVVKGKAPSARANQYDLLEIVKQVPRKDVEYPADTLPGRARPLRAGLSRRASGRLRRSEAECRRAARRRRPLGPASPWRRESDVGQPRQRHLPAGPDRPAAGCHLCAAGARPDAHLRHAGRRQLRARRPLHHRRLSGRADRRQDQLRGSPSSWCRSSCSSSASSSSAG